MDKKQILDSAKKALADLTDNERKIKLAALRIAFLMPHQEVNPDLELEALNLTPVGNGINLDAVDKNSPEYILGARDALLCLIRMLEGKGPQRI